MEKLVTMYVGTIQIRETKMNILVHQYENFSMKSDETVQQMYERLTLLVNALEHLEKSFTNGELVRKVLRTLPRSWKAKKMAIEEARDFTTLPLEQLMSSLISYEIDKSSRPDIKPVTVAFKATREIAEASDDDTEAETDTDDELAMITKRLLKFASKHRFNKNKGERKRHSKQLELRCFECNTKGHIKTDCPFLREKKQPSAPNKEGSLCLRTEAKENEWYLDNGCSKHMSGDPSKFSTLTLQNGGSVSFGDNSKCFVIGTGTVDTLETMVIEDVQLVIELKHNLLSISQLCDKGYITFDKDSCYEMLDNKVRFIEKRRRNIYSLSPNSFCNTKNCLLFVKDESYL
ncbi:hypothetical protein MLD38_006249 [Melastoma candidum]|uniref:Uncharacterized protein n=1 Tax=Melastoma candidum TaxID=119954 RepID=A0ACB9RMU3_9MYRT|nr:hypothetical protein MLD38_006249 [Melastoma candidum]